MTCITKASLSSIVENSGDCERDFTHFVSINQKYCVIHCYTIQRKPNSSILWCAIKNDERSDDGTLSNFPGIM